MDRRPGLLFPLCVTLALGIIPCSTLQAQEVPPALSGWQDWVMHGQEHRRCPLLSGSEWGEAASHPCAWPQRLRLDSDASGARFSIRWRAFAETWLPLPGDAQHWPLNVRVDGVARPVVEHDGGPALWVAAGNHLLEGSFDWQRRPESLRVPTTIALIDLTLDGDRVFPLQRDGASLWLGQPEAQAGHAESLAVLVYRRLADGLPPLLETRLRLDVSGQGREEVIGPVLPEGFVPVFVSGELPALLEGDGRLRIQLRPGNWQVVLEARATEPLAQVTLSLPQGGWPGDEIWSYQAAPSQRITAASGGTPVDPSQVDVPDEWAQLPAFKLTNGTTLTIEQRSRGMADDANRLSLSRQLWLDFDGKGMTTRDTVTGRMVRDFRLDMDPPFELRRAQADGQPLLVTLGAGEGLSGVELRNPQVRLEASARIDRAGGALPVTGWRTSFEEVNVELNLPPARVLVAAIGADSSPQAWIDRWSLLDVFLFLITTLLGVRLLGRKWGAVLGGFLILSYHESVGPLWCLLLVLALSLLRGALTEGRLATTVGALRAVALLVLVLVILPFVGNQLSLVLYPQLEAEAMAYPSDSGLILQSGLASPAAPPVENDAWAEVEQQLAEAEPRSKIGVSRIAPKRLRRYAESNVFQAGGGEPQWRWRRAGLSWAGPVMPEQRLRLVVLPAWLTRLLRMLMVGLLAVVVWRLFVTLRDDLGLEGTGTAGAAAAATMVAALLLAAPVTAQQTPDPALLDQLRQRLLEPPRCAPSCARIEEAIVETSRDSLTVNLVVHAAARAAVPLPGSDAAWRITELRLGDEERTQLLRDTDGRGWLPVERGVHRVRMSGPLVAAETAELHFPAVPARVVVGGSGWDHSGVRDARLLTDTLTLVRVRRDDDGPGITGAALKVPPFVQVRRELDLDLDWGVTTTVLRLAPRDGSLTTVVPLLPGESVLTPGLEVRDGELTAAIPAGVDQLSWTSRLQRVDRFELKAADLGQRSETWRIAVSPQWSAAFEGLPATYPSDVQDYWVHEFHPLPGETLTVTVGRPAAVAGATLAIDRAEILSEVGRRASEHRLELHLRSTRGGQHILTLPEEAEVLEVNIDGTVVNMRPEQGRLPIPVHPGEQQLTVRWRDGQGAGLWSGSPAVDLGASASNLRVVIKMPRHRWVLATLGPQVGPAVLYWGELLVMALVAFLLARLGRSRLGFAQWMLLGLGFSAFSWFAFAVVVIWLLALSARAHLSESLPWWRFNLVQLALAGFTCAALICLLIAIPFGLLGTPNMHISGLASSAYSLQWFDDLSEGPMPQASVLSLPLILYRLAMLAWALWLASSIVGWLRWGWQSATTGGGWRRRDEPPPADTSAADTHDQTEGGG